MNDETVGWKSKVNRAVKILGVILRMMLPNFEEIMHFIKEKLKLWRLVNLTVIGRIQITKT